MTCSIEGCANQVYVLKRGWCRAHYLRWYRNGNPLGYGGTERGAAASYFKEVVLPYRGQDCLIWPFSDKGNGYAQIMRNRRPAVVSRLVCAEVHGPAPSQEYQAAHSCGNGDLGCVSPSHISWKTSAENEADKKDHGTYYLRWRNGRKAA